MTRFSVAALAAVMTISAGLIAGSTGGALAQARGNFDNGDGSMGFRVSGDGRILPAVGGGSNVNAAANVRASAKVAPRNNARRSVRASAGY